MSPKSHNLEELVHIIKTIEDENPDASKFEIANAICYTQWGRAASGANIGTFVMVPDEKLRLSVERSGLFDNQDTSYSMKDFHHEEIDLKHFFPAFSGYYTADHTDANHDFYNYLSKLSLINPGMNFNLINLGLKITGHDKKLERGLWFSVFGDRLQDVLMYDQNENPSQYRGDLLGYYCLKDSIASSEKLSHTVEHSIEKHGNKVLGDSYKKNPYYLTGKIMINPITKKILNLFGENIDTINSDRFGKVFTDTIMYGTAAIVGLAFCNVIYQFYNFLK